MFKLFNALTKTSQEIKPLDGQTVRIYSCGPTVYDNLHIGNLVSFIYADTLRRSLQVCGYQVHHVMNITDIDDKTIRDSQSDYPNDEPMTALNKLTRKYEQVFLDDMKLVGNEISDLDLIRATDSIAEMQSVIKSLIDANFAYIRPDGVYFSIQAYRQAGHIYGQLTQLDDSQAISRIAKDEYDQDQIADFALWKKQTNYEPAWPFKYNDTVLDGRPGWHIECSVMSKAKLGQPFDIHTGGVDLKFPHHENEIAQSTALQKPPAIYAETFFYNQHLLVDGKKMAKSSGNFYTLREIEKQRIEPLAFRLAVLQSHYRKQMNFSLEALQAANNRLVHLRALADLRFQASQQVGSVADTINQAKNKITRSLSQDLNTAEALSHLSLLDDKLNNGLAKSDLDSFKSFLNFVDQALGLQLLASQDLDQSQISSLNERLKARQSKDWQTSDQIRNELAQQGIEIRDVGQQQIWSRT